MVKYVDLHNLPFAFKSNLRLIIKAYSFRLLNNQTEQYFGLQIRINMIEYRIDKEKTSNDNTKYFYYKKALCIYFSVYHITPTIMRLLSSTNLGVLQLLFTSN